MGCRNGKEAQTTDNDGSYGSVRFSGRNSSLPICLPGDSPRVCFYLDHLVVNYWLGIQSPLNTGIKDRSQPFQCLPKGGKFSGVCPVDKVIKKYSSLAAPGS